MLRILLIYYSQSGEAERVAEVFSETLKSAEIDLAAEVLRPESPYPFPWKRIANFFDVLPECHFGPVPQLEPVRFDPDQKFDLVILIYQVWFLAPSLPIQSFLKSPAARVLKNTKVLTVSVSRNMWQSASETMKELLRPAGALHSDNVAVTHQGPIWATFITTPRALLFGKKNAFWGIFPAAGLDSQELDRIRRFGEAIAARKEEITRPENQPLLRGLGAVRIESRYLLGERVGWHCFRWWGRRIQALGRRGKVPRRAGVYCFIAFLVCALPIILPCTMLVRLLFRPILRPWMTSYVNRLQQPSESSEL